MAIGQGHVLIAMNQDHALTVMCQGDMLTREIHFSGSFLSRGGTLACLVVQVVGVLGEGQAFPTPRFVVVLLKLQIYEPGCADEHKHTHPLLFFSVPWQKSEIHSPSFCFYLRLQATTFHLILTRSYIKSHCDQLARTAFRMSHRRPRPAGKVGRPWYLEGVSLSTPVPIDHLEPLFGIFSSLE